MRDVDLDVAYGERRAILGPNGAGKTTLFNVISGDIRRRRGDRVPRRGHLRDLGRRPQRLGIGRTYQKSRLFLGLCVEDNLYLAVLGSRDGHLRPCGAGPDAGCASEPRARPPGRPRVGLASLVGSISHGEQRQLEVAMARATEPKLMLLDEPASGLSRGERVALTDLLLELARASR